MDRGDPAVAKLQDSFIAHIVNPLAIALNDAKLLPGANFHILFHYRIVSHSYLIFCFSSSWSPWKRIDYKS